MKRFHLHHLGRFGNNLFGYAFARGYCERHGLELHIDPWIGERLFSIEHPRCTEDLPRRDEFTLIDGESDISYRSYSQQQKCADYYSQSQCQRWFTLRPDIARRAAHYPSPHVLAHHRADDYAPLGYVVVSKQSYLRAAEEHGFDPRTLTFVEQSNPHIDPYFEGWGEFVPDFLRLMNARVLFRANSSFSWWASTISGARTFSPVIDGLVGGREQDCKFVEGNWPRLASLEFVTDLHLAK